MELREIFVTAIAIMDEKSGTQSDGNYEMLWTKDWDHLREILLEGLNLVDKTEGIVGLRASAGTPNREHWVH